MSSIIHINGDPYLVMSEERVGTNMRKLRVSKYRGKTEDPRLTNAPAGLILVDADNIDDPKEVTVQFDKDALPRPIANPSVEPYVPPEGEATMNVYCLQNRAGRRFWYVNASKTKQYREERMMQDAQFITFEVPKTKAGLIHFLNEVCG